ncbi:hypothetical protein THAOC_24827 [Thalassiosira oceanica]|uniref:Uncharacterized protein n=1 Tax=Thalassiosira oceanica TaxID=159749 RepID=K0RNT4_THAOC|nr:hypothetical protein THAOC_24827 [Thalassiosira oceanica]|eukprot:EJK55443.1 hypothetical protein THAOC_24827 [Thalassiosira oceanica]
MSAEISCGYDTANFTATRARAAVSRVEKGVPLRPQLSSTTLEIRHPPSTWIADRPLLHRLRRRLSLLGRSRVISTAQTFPCRVLQVPDDTCHAVVAPSFGDQRRRWGDGAEAIASTSTPIEISTAKGSAMRVGRRPGQFPELFPEHVESVADKTDPDGSKEHGDSRTIREAVIKDKENFVGVSSESKKVKKKAFYSRESRVCTSS